MNMMKKILILSLAFLPLMVYAQYVITGDLYNVPDGEIVLNIRGIDTDSARINKGHFVLRSKKHLSGAHYVSLSTRDSKWGTMFWMQNDSICIQSTINGYQLSGSKTEDEYQDYLKWMSPIWDEIKVAKNNAGKDVGKMEDTNTYIEKVLEPKSDSIFMIWARQHPSSYVALNHIYNCRGLKKYPLSRYVPMFSALKDGAFEGSIWDDMNEYIAEDEALEPGHLFPSYTMSNAYGDTVSNGSYKGKIVLYYIGYTTQKEYIHDFDIRQSLYSSYHDQGLEMCDMLMVRRHSDVVRAVVQNNIQWDVMTDLKGFYSPFIENAHIDHVPHTFLVGRDGKIIAHNVFGSELKESIDSLFIK